MALIGTITPMLGSSEVKREDICTRCSFHICLIDLNKSNAGRSVGVQSVGALGLDLKCNAHIPLDKHGRVSGIPFNCCCRQGCDITAGSYVCTYVNFHI